MTVSTFTSSWRSTYEASKLGPLAFTPVRISIGSPRFMKTKGFPAVNDLMPWGLFGIHDRADFEPKFRARLDDIGIEPIGARLEEIAAEHGSPLVLLCFEDVSGGANWCHREIAAAWLEEHGWGPVRELNQPSVQLRLEVER
jgi:hypothetical protein